MLRTRFLKTIAIAILVAYPGRALAQGLKSDVSARSDGHVLLTVTNHSGSAVTAMVAVGTRTLLATGATVRSVRFFDSILSPLRSRSLLPEQEHTFVFFGPRPAPDQITRKAELKAAIFADGSTWGDLTWVDTLLLRRSSALRYNTKILEMVERAVSAGASGDDLRQQLSDTEKTDLAAAQTVAEKQMVEVAYQNTLLLLQDPARADGSVIPPAESGAHARSQLSLRISALSKSKPTLAR